MPDDRPNRTEVIELWVSPAEKDLLARAAAREQTNLESFVMRSALRGAERLARSHEVMLDEQKVAQVANLVENPPEPNEALVEAFRQYRKRSLDR